MVKRPATSSHSQRLPAPHTHDGAKTHLTPSVAPPHGGAAGDNVNGRRSGHERDSLWTPVFRAHTQQPRTPGPSWGGRGENSPRNSPTEHLREKESPRGRKAGRPQAPPTPPNAAAGEGDGLRSRPLPRALAAVSDGEPWAQTASDFRLQDDGLRRGAWPASPFLSAVFEFGVHRSPRVAIPGNNC